MRLISFVDLKNEFNANLDNNLDHWLKCVKKFSFEEDHNIKKNFISTKYHSGISNDFEEADFDELLNYFKSPNVLPALIVIPDSRYIAKNLIELVEKIIEINSLNCKIQCINSNWNDPINDGLNRLTLNGLLNESEIRKRNSIIFKVNRGEVVTKSPIGYKIGSEGNLVIDESHQDVVRKIFSLYTGIEVDQFNQIRRKLGIRRISDYLNAEGIRTKNGNTWSPSSVDVVLKNRTYTGIYKRSGIIITNNHPVLISEDIFQKAQNIRASRNIFKSPRENRLIFKKGLIKCGICFRNMNFKNIFRIWENISGYSRKKNYRYYYCFSISCSGKNINNIRFEILFEEISKQIRKIVKGYKKSFNKKLVYWEFPKDDKFDEKKKILEKNFLNTLRDVSKGKLSLDNLRNYIERLNNMEKSFSKEQTINLESIYSELQNLDFKNEEKIFYFINNLTNLISIKNNSVRINIKKPIVFDS
tara:strand:+ start:1860 stop:3278 length:1419 start_codon:yes stop_codon:yes gene_type:complete